MQKGKARPDGIDYREMKIDLSGLPEPPYMSEGIVSFRVPVEAQIPTDVLWDAVADTHTDLTKRECSDIAERMAETWDRALIERWLMGRVR